MHANFSGSLSTSAGNHIEPEIKTPLCTFRAMGIQRATVQRRPAGAGAPNSEVAIGLASPRSRQIASTKLRRALTLPLPTGSGKGYNCRASKLQDQLTRRFKSHLSCEIVHERSESGSSAHPRRWRLLSLGCFNVPIRVHACEIPVSNQSRTSRLSAN